MDENKDLYNGTIVLKARSHIEIDKVESIASFESDYVELVTKWGNLVIIGKNMTIISLDKTGGNIIIEGVISDVSFLDKKTKKKSGSIFG